MIQAAEMSIPDFFNEAVYPTQAEATSLPWVSDLWQQTTSLGRLRQMETMSVSVRLYTEQACCGSFSRHSGSSSAFKYRLRPLH